jgi:hypothetical protein
LDEDGVVVGNQQSYTAREAGRLTANHTVDRIEVAGKKLHDEISLPALQAVNGTLYRGDDRVTRSAAETISGIEPGWVKY